MQNTHTHQMLCYVPQGLHEDWRSGWEKYWRYSQPPRECAEPSLLKDAIICIQKMRETKMANIFHVYGIYIY